MKRSVWVVAAALGVAGLAAWWFGPGARERTLARYPRVVLVTIDTLHLLHTGLFDPEVAGTPHLERLAADGVLFRQARTTVPMTLPSHASMLSGRTPVGMGLLRNGEKVAPTVRTLAEVLSEAGYRTGAFLSLATLRRDYGLDRGFEVYDDGYDEVPRFYRTADEVLAAALPWIEERAGERYFAWVHLSDPHEPYGLKGAPPDVVVDLDGAEIAKFNLESKERHELQIELDPGRHVLRWTSLRSPAPDDREGTELYLRFRDNDTLLDYVASWEALPRPEASLVEPLELHLERRPEQPASVTVRFDGGLRKPPPSVVRPNYALEVEYVDRHLGLLREAVERQGPVLWIVASDHGEGVYRHRGVVGHAGFNREDQLRILWLMAGPGLPAGERVDHPALVHDIAPTVLDLIGLPPLPDAEGASLLPCLRQRGCPERDQWYAHGFSQRHDKLSAIATYRWPHKSVVQDAPGSGLYRLDDDPWEQRNLASSAAGETDLVARRLHRDLQEVRALLERLIAAEERDLSEDDLELLRSLGYLGN